MFDCRRFVCLVLVLVRLVSAAFGHTAGRGRFLSQSSEHMRLFYEASDYVEATICIYVGNDFNLMLLFLDAIMR